MGVKQLSLHCKNCGKKTLFTKQVFGSVAGTMVFCLLMGVAGLFIWPLLIVGGAYLVLWLVVRIVQVFKPYRCQTCGQARY